MLHDYYIRITSSSSLINFLSSGEQVTGISMESVLVASNLNGCAFVYGSLSFLDKVSCGLALFFLESYQSSSLIEPCM